MAIIIRQRRVVADNWQLLKSVADGSLAVPAEGDVIVPLGVWCACTASNYLDTL